MGHFHQSLIQENAELLERARTHPLFAQAAMGTIPRERFLDWIAKNYLWVRDFERFLAAVSAQAPRMLGRAFCEALINLHGEIELYEELCARTDANVKDASHSYASSAFGNFLLATANTRSFEESLSAIYACNLSFRDAWANAKEKQTSPAPWQDFVDLWTDAGFSRWIDKLAEFIDQVAEQASESTRAQMKEIFPIAVHYALRHWDSGLEGADW